MECSCVHSDKPTHSIKFWETFLGNCTTGGFSIRAQGNYCIKFFRLKVFQCLVNVMRMDTYRKCTFYNKINKGNYSIKLVSLCTTFFDISDSFRVGVCFLERYCMIFGINNDYFLTHNN